MTTLRDESRRPTSHNVHGDVGSSKHLLDNDARHLSQSGHVRVLLRGIHRRSHFDDAQLVAVAMKGASGVCAPLLL